MARTLLVLALLSGCVQDGDLPDAGSDAGPPAMCGDCLPDRFGRCPCSEGRPCIEGSCDLPLSHICDLIADGTRVEEIASLVPPAWGSLEGLTTVPDAEIQAALFYGNADREVGTVLQLCVPDPTACPPALAFLGAECCVDHPDAALYDRAALVRLQIAPDYCTGGRALCHVWTVDGEVVARHYYCDN